MKPSFASLAAAPAVIVVLVAGPALAQSSPANAPSAPPSVTPTEALPPGPPPPAALPVVQEAPATVYIYRQKSFAYAARTAVMSVDDVRLGTVTYSGCLVAHIPPGHHELKHRWDLLMDPLSAIAKIGGPVTWRAGEVYYYRISASVTGVYPMTLEWRLEQVDAGEGAQQIGNCAGDTPIEFSDLLAKRKRR